MFEELLPRLRIRDWRATLRMCDRSSFRPSNHPDRIYAGALVNSENQRKKASREVSVKSEGGYDIHRSVSRHHWGWQRDGPSLGETACQRGATVAIIDVNSEGMADTASGFDVMKV